MNKFLRDVKNKAESLVEVAQAENPVAQGKKLLNGIKRKALLKNSKKELNTFYSDKNFLKVRAMLEADIKTLGTAAERQLKDLQIQLSGAPSADHAAKILGLNFFNVYVELRSQEALYELYPEYIFQDSLELAKYEELIGTVKTLKSKVEAYAKQYKVISAFKNELTKRDAEIHDYRDLVSLIK